MGLTDLLKKRNAGAPLQRLCFALLAAALQTGCTAFENAPKAQTYRLLWPQVRAGKVDYVLQNIEINSLDEPDKLIGPAIEVMVNPRADGGRPVAGESIVRYVRNGDVAVPADFVSLQAVTVFAHLDRLHALDRALGLAPALNGKERAGVMVVTPANQHSQAPLLNNAVYDGNLDALFVVPFTEPNLPLSQNAGVIAHEHFHRLFQATVLRRRDQMGAMPCLRHGLGITGDVAGRFDLAHDETTLSNFVVLRGLNEGLADFWGWAYSGDDSFVARSLGEQEDLQRRLDPNQVDFPSVERLKKELFATDGSGRKVLRSEGVLIGAAYKFGTQYARVLRGLADSMAETGAADERSIGLVRAALSVSLPDLQAKVAKALNGQVASSALETDVFIASIMATLKSPKFQRENNWTWKIAQLAATCSKLVNGGISKGARGKDCETLEREQEEVQR